MESFDQNAGDRGRGLAEQSIAYSFFDATLREARALAAVQRDRQDGSQFFRTQSSDRSNGESLLYRNPAANVPRNLHADHRNYYEIRNASAPKPVGAVNHAEAKFAKIQAKRVQHAFDDGHAGKYTPRELVKAGVVTHVPLRRNSVFERSGPVKFIVVHSTETKYPADAERVIKSWNNQPGRLTKGTQYVIDRDGDIYSTADPSKATIHLNDRITKHGIKNANSIGIELVHTGNQKYTWQQKQSLIELVSYLQNRYHVTNDHVVTHRYAQPATRRDPVNFAWNDFQSQKTRFQKRSMMA